MPIGSSKIGVLGAGLVPGGSVTFNTSGNWTVPPGVKKVSITGKGGTGNPGNPGNAGNAGNPGGGGGGGGAGGFFFNPPTNLGCVTSKPGGTGGGGAAAGTTPSTPNPAPSNQPYTSNAGAAGSSGNTGSAGNPGNPGNAGPASTALGQNFAGGSGGSAGNGGAGGNGGTGGTGGAGSSATEGVYLGPNCGSALPVPFNPGGASNTFWRCSPAGGSGGNGGGSGSQGRAFSRGGFFNAPGCPASTVWGGQSGAGGGGAGETNNGGNASVAGPLPITYTYPPSFSVSPPITAIKISGGPFPGTVVPTLPFSKLTGGAGGTPGGGAGGNGEILGNTPLASGSVNAGGNGTAPRAGGGGGGAGFPSIGAAGPTPCANVLRGRYLGGGGGGGGRGNAGNSGSSGNAGGSGSVANPSTVNCVNATPGSTVPITVGSPGGQVVISWNPQ